MNSSINDIQRSLSRRQERGELRQFEIYKGSGRFQLTFEDIKFHGYDNLKWYHTASCRLGIIGDADANEKPR